MRTTIVPAQITTVEDRIAGNLTMAQLLILIAGFGLATAVYLVAKPHYHINLVKSVFMLVTVLAITPLAVRIRGKILAEWLVVLTRYHQRPRRYAFTKDDPDSRAEIDTPALKTKEPAVERKPIKVVTKPVTIDIEEHDRVGELLGNPGLAVRFVMAEKGGVDVTLTPLKR